MWIYVPFYRSICKKESQIMILNKVEETAKTKEVINESGKTIIKHEIGFWDFNKINIGVTYK